MRLAKEDVELFYKLHWTLLFYTNQKYPVIEGLSLPNLEGQNMEDIAKLDEKLYSHLELIDSFINENPFNLNQEEITIIKSWKNFVRDKFFILSHQKEYTIFLNSDKELKAYGVLGLYDEIEDIIPFEPCMVETTLLPFKGKIIYSGILRSFSISFGGGMKRTLNRDYQKAKSKFGVITSLDESITEKKDSDEEMLRFYLRNERNRYEYEEEINRILEKNPSILKLYYQELSKANSRKIRKKLNNAGVNSGFFGVLNDVIIASGQSEKEVKKQIENLLPEEKREYVYILKYNKK